MYSLRLVNRVRPAQQARLISNCPTLRDSKPTGTTPNVQESTTKIDFSNPSVMTRRLITLSNRDKKILLWTKTYKNVDEIPEQISYEALDKAQNRFRIRIANWMMVGMIVGTIIMVYAGKERAERGDSAAQINIDWHKKINAEYQASLAKTGAEKKE